MTDPNDMSNSDNKINGTDFELMITAVDNWDTSTQGILEWVYIRTNGVKTAQFISKAKFDQMKTRWGAIVQSQNIAINIGTPAPPAAPVVPVFEMSYFVNPDDTPNYNLTDIKNEGATGILLKVSRLASSSNYFGNILPDAKTKCQAAGLGLRAWLSGNLNSDNSRMDSRLPTWQTSVNEMVTAVKAVGALGIPVHVDLDNGDLAANVDNTNAYIKALHDAIPSNIEYTITGMPNAPGYDNSLAYGENYATLIPLVTFLSPEIYGYSYTADPTIMANAIKGMIQQYGTKILPSIQIISDSGETLTKDQIAAQVQIMKNAGAPGVFIFRWFGNPSTSPSVGPIQAAIQDALGSSFTTFTEYFNLVKKYCKYSGYFNNKFDLDQEIANMKQSRLTPSDAVLDADNCVDYAQVSHALATEMKYTVRFVGIYCTVDQINHAYIELQGFEFGNTWTPADLAQATSDGTDIGSHWCDGEITYNPSWIPSEDNGAV